MTTALRRRRRIDSAGVLVLPLVAYLLVAFVAPIGLTLVQSFTDPKPGLQQYRRFLDEGVYADVLRTTFTTSLGVTLVVLVLAFPYAYLMTLVGRRARALMIGIVLVPFWTSLLIRSFALVVILRDSGVVNSALMDLGLVSEPVPLIRNFTGVLIGMSQILLPFMVLPIYATMRQIDPRLVQAAESLGARPAFAFWRIYAPLCLPGVAAGVLLCFVQALGYYITPALLGGPGNMMLGELIVQQVSGLLNWGFASALAVILLVCTGLTLLMASRLVDVRKMVGGGL